MWRGALLATLALFATLPSPAGAAGTFEWQYVISAPHAADGLVHVELTLHAAEGRIAAVAFHPELVRGKVTNLTAAPGTSLSREDGVVTMRVDGDERISYDVAAGRRASLHGGGYTSYVNASFALFDAAEVYLPAGYSSWPDIPWSERVSVELSPPAGWSATAPWPRADAGSRAVYLPPTAPTPRGIVVMGDYHVQRSDAAGRDVELVALRPLQAWEQDLLADVAELSASMEDAYGAPEGAKLLVVAAPEPIHEGAAGKDSILLGEDANLKTLAHELAHAHQRFDATTDAGAHTEWFIEGDAEYRAILALVDTGHMTTAGARTHFRDAARNDWRQERLVDAQYPTTDLVYGKGLLVVRALDEAIARASEGRAGLSDVERGLGGPGDPRASVEEIAGFARAAGGAEAAAVVDQYANGTGWPKLASFVAPGTVEVAIVSVTPGGPGDQPRAVLEGRAGVRAARVSPDVLVDGERVATLAFDLPPMGVERIELPLPVASAGKHTLRVGDVERPFFVGATPGGAQPPSAPSVAEAQRETPQGAWVAVAALAILALSRRR